MDSVTHSESDDGFDVDKNYRNTVRAAAETIKIGFYCDRIRVVSAIDYIRKRSLETRLERKKNIKPPKETSSNSLGHLALRRLRKDKLALVGAYIIILAAIISVLGSVVRPDKTVNANDQMLQLARNQPGFSVDVLDVRKNKEIESVSFWDRLLLGGKELPGKKFPFKEYHFEGDEIIIVNHHSSNNQVEEVSLRFKLADVLWPVKSDGITYDKNNDRVLAELIDGTIRKTTVAEMQQMVLEENLYTQTFWLGTDKFGRDLLSRIMGGTIVSLGVGVISVLISLIIGISLGAIAGYFRGWVDEMIMWLINVMWSVPTLLMVMAITLALGKGFTQVYIAVGLTMWVEVARVVRGQVLSLREQEFIEAGRALGFNSTRLIGKHILPNVMAPVIVISAANFASAILIEAGLSFLGIGAQIPMPSWGQMIKEHYSYITTDLAYLAVLPGICIMILVLAFMLLGNGLRDALDQKAVG